MSLIKAAKRTDQQSPNSPVPFRGYQRTNLGQRTKISKNNYQLHICYVLARRRITGKPMIKYNLILSLTEETPGQKRTKENKRKEKKKKEN